MADDVSNLSDDELQQQINAGKYQQAIAKPVEELSDDQLESKIALAKGKEDWKADDDTHPKERRRRLLDHLATHAVASTPYGQAMEDYQQRFPDQKAIDPDLYQHMVANPDDAKMMRARAEVEANPRASESPMLNRALIAGQALPGPKALEAVSQGVEALSGRKPGISGDPDQRDESLESWITRRGIAFSSSALNFGRDVEYGRAKKRIDEGKAQPDDFRIVAAHEHQMGQDQEQGKTWSGTALNIAARTPAMIGEFAAGGEIAGAAMKGGAAGLRGAGLMAPAAPEAAAVSIPAFFSREGMKEAGKAMVNPFTPSGLARTSVLTASVPSIYAEKWAQENIRQGRDPMDVRGLPAAYGLGVLQLSVMGSVGGSTAKAFPYAGTGQAVGRVGTAGVTGGLAVGPSADIVSGAVQDALGMQSDYGSFGLMKEGKYGEAAKHALEQAITFAAFAGAHEATGPQRPTQAFNDLLAAQRKKGASLETAVNAAKPAEDAIANVLKETPHATRADALDAVKDLPPDVIPLGKAYANALPEKPIETPPAAPPSPLEGEASPRAAPEPQEAQEGPTPPPGKGMVRFYHGGDLPEDASGKGGRDFTPDPEYARGYAEKHGGKVAYIDLPEDHPLVEKSFDDSGTNVKAPYKAFSAPEDVAKGRKQYVAEPPKPAEPAGEVEKMAQDIFKNGKNPVQVLDAQDALTKAAVIRRVAELKGQNPAQLPGDTVEPTGAVEGATDAAKEASARTGKPVPTAEETPAHIQPELEAAFPGARMTPRGELEAHLGSKVIYVGPDDGPASVRIDFEDNARSGVQKDVQAGSKDFLRGIRNFVEDIAAKGIRVEFRAIDSNRPGGSKGVRNTRADIYARALDKAGYEQVAGPDAQGYFRWEPKSEAKGEAKAPAEKSPWQETYEKGKRGGMNEKGARAMADMLHGEEGGKLVEATPKEAPSPEAAPEEEVAARLTADELHRRLVEGQDIPGLSKTEQSDLYQHIVEQKPLADIGKQRGVNKQKVARSIENALQKLHGNVEEPGQPTEAPGQAARATPPGELPNRWVENPTSENLSDAILDHIQRSHDEGRQLSQKEEGRLYDLAQRVTDVAASRKEQRAAAAEATAFLTSLKRGAEQPPSVRRGEPERLPAGNETRGPADAEHLPSGQPAPGDAESAPAPGRSSEAPGNELKPDSPYPEEPGRPFAMGAAALGELTPSAPGREGPRRVALANESIDSERLKDGLSPILGSARSTDAEVWDKAMRRLELDPEAGKKLAEELASKPRSTTDVENALLLRHRVAISNEYRGLEKTYERLADKGGHDADLAVLQDRIGTTLEDLYTADLAAKRSGSEWGKAGRFRQMLMAEDFSVERMIGAKRAAVGRPLTPEEGAKVKEMSDKIADLQAKVDAKAADPKSNVNPETWLKFKLYEARQEYLKSLEADRLKNRTVVQKAFGAIGEAANVARSIITSMDYSAVFRQGGMTAMSHPWLSIKAIPEMIQAGRSKYQASRAQQALEARPNYENGLYKRSGLYFAEKDAGLSGMEESYMSRLADKIPGVAGSERAYTTYLNRIRADVFDSLVGTLGKKGAVTDAEARVIANYVNASTGRGSLGFAEKAAVPLATVFFSPRFLASRFQLLSGQPMWGGTGRTRGLIAKEYARAALGLAVVYGMSKLVGRDDAEIGTDPGQADFGKIRIGNSRIDPLFSMSQTARFTYKEGAEVANSVKRMAGYNVPEKKFGDPDAADILGRFLRTKLAPVPGAALDVATGKNVVGEPQTLLPHSMDAALTGKSHLGNLSIPLSIRDVYEAMQDQGVPKGAALGILAAFGMGFQAYEDKKKQKIKK